MLKRLDLHASNTPLIHIPSLSATLGVQFYIKRDDLCSAACGYSGSAMRKIEFVLPDLADKGTTDVIVVGNYHSNYIRQLAQICCTYGIRCHCIYTNQPDTGDDMNVFLAQMYGAIIHTNQGSDYVTSVLEAITESGGIAYLATPEGRESCAIMGGLSLFDELKLDLKSKFDIDEATIYVGSDTGTTLAGMLYGNTIAHVKEPHSIKIIGVPIFGKPDDQKLLVRQNLDTICQLVASEAPEQRFTDVEVKPETVWIHMSDIQLPRGTISYDLVTISKWFFQNTQVLLDPIYGLHTVTAMIRDIQDGKLSGNVVFVNPSLPVDIFGYKSVYRSVLDEEHRRATAV